MDFKLFSTTNNDYVLDVNNSLIFQIDEEHKNFFENIDCKKTKDFPDDVITLIKEGKNLINDFKNNINNKEYNLESISLILTNQCNFACKYCYNSDYIKECKMSIETAKKAINFLIDNSIDENLTVIFFGGEPLLNKRLIKEVVEYCILLGYNKGKKFYFSITTNATLMDDEIKKFMIDNKFHFNISIDGDDHTHNCCRKYKNGNSTYSNVIDGIEGLPILSRTARGTITKNNTDLFSLYKHLSLVQFNNVHFEIVSTEVDTLDLDLQDIDKVIEGYRKICEEFYKNYKDNVKLNNGAYGQIKDDIEKIDRQTIRAYFCKAAKNYVAIDTDGKIYPCHRYIGNKKYSIGDLYNGFSTEKNKYVDATIFSKKECGICWARFLCGGGCYHEAEITNNDILSPSNKKCYYIRKILEESFKLYLRLKESGLDDVNELFC